MTDGDEGAGVRGTYLSYLLRLWRVDGQESPLWRASLKSAHTGEQVGFSSLEALFEHLRAETGGEATTQTSEVFRDLRGLQEGKGGADANSVDPEPADL